MSIAKVTGQPLVHFSHWKQADIFCPLSFSILRRSDGLGTTFCGNGATVTFLPLSSVSHFPEVVNQSWLRASKACE